MFRIAAIVATAGLAAAAHADILAGWTFEVSIPATAGPHAAEVGSGSALGWHANAATVYSNPVGNGSAESFSSDKWSVGDYYQFQTSTLGYMSITLTFDHTSSNTGPRDFEVQWSIDGATFITLASYSVLANATPNAWTSVPPRNPLHTYGPFAAPAALNNQANVWFRLRNSTTVSANGGTVATTGTSRVDNVDIEGVLIPTPGTLALFGFAGLAAARRRR
ncbi:MAG: hypothetical protein FJ255_02240 [Phycisphaerae bacterium]|nr:hypothetical protein [Phycisphaerae bacterium]